MPRTNKGGGPSWRWDHDPFARPLGCNGKYGSSGIQRHSREGTTPCAGCRESYAHVKRERRRGGITTLKPPTACGTATGARRHRRNGDPVCLPCRVAEARYRYHLRQIHKLREAVPTGAASSIPNTKDQAA